MSIMPDVKMLKNVDFDRAFKQEKIAVQFEYTAFVTPQQNGRVR